MAILLSNTKQREFLCHIYEDPDPEQGRIFINGQGHDVVSLQPLWGVFWGGQDTSNSHSPYPHRDEQAKKPIITSGFHKFKFYSLDWGEIIPGNTDPWFVSLDYNNYKANWYIKLRSGMLYWQDPAGGWDDGSGQYGDRYWTYDFNEPAVANMSRDTANIFALYHEDPLYPGDVWVHKNYRNRRLFGKITIGSGSTVARWYFDPGQSQSFMVGRTNNNSLIWAVLNAGNNNLQFYEFFDGGGQGPASYDNKRLVFTHIHENQYLSQHWQFPSNIRRSSENRRVFYQAAWDNTGGLFSPGSDRWANKWAEKRLVWYRLVFDPNTSNMISERCSLRYPAGTDSRNYMRMTGWGTDWWNASTGSSQVQNNKSYFFYKPHQFFVGNRWFITLMFFSTNGFDWWSYTFFRDSYTEGNEHPHNTWITYEINSTDDKILTYHSIIEWDSARDQPGWYMPLNEAGNQLFIKRFISGVHTISFNVVTGWVIHDQQDWNIASIGTDSIGRVYMQIIGGGRNGFHQEVSSYEHHNLGGGNGRIVTYNWSNPTQIKVYSTVTSFAFTGTSFTSQLSFDAFDYTGNRIEIPLRLNIAGNGMTFDDGSVSRIVSSSTSTTATTAVLITGAGRPIISVNLA